MWLEIAPKNVGNRPDKADFVLESLWLAHVGNFSGMGRQIDVFWFLYLSPWAYFGNVLGTLTSLSKLLLVGLTYQSHDVRQILKLSEMDRHVTITPTALA